MSKKLLCVFIVMQFHSHSINRRHKDKRVSIIGTWNKPHNGTHLDKPSWITTILYLKDYALYFD